MGVLGAGGLCDKEVGDGGVLRGVKSGDWGFRGEVKYGGEMGGEKCGEGGCGGILECVFDDMGGLWWIA